MATPTNRLPTSFIAQKLRLPLILPVVLMCVLLLLGTSCSQANQDKNIKADIAAKAKNELNFAAVNYTVDGGVVTLTGKCTSEKSKGEVEQTIKSINIVKGIINRIEIAPVVLNGDLVLKQAVDSVLKDFPLVEAEVKGNIITLQGKTEKKGADKILAGLNQLHPNKIDNQLKLQ